MPPIKKLIASTAFINNTEESETTHLLPNSQSAYTAINESVSAEGYQNTLQFQPPAYQHLNHNNTKLCPTCKGRGRIGIVFKILK